MELSKKTTEAAPNSETIFSKISRCDDIYRRLGQRLDKTRRELDRATTALQIERQRYDSLRSASLGMAVASWLIIVALAVKLWMVAR